jgi:hypothetical protein
MGKDFSKLGTLFESIKKTLARGMIYHEGTLNSFAAILVRLKPICISLILSTYKTLPFLNY